MQTQSQFKVRLNSDDSESVSLQIIQSQSHSEKLMTLIKVVFEFETK